MNIDFLACTPIINFDDPNVAALAEKLAVGRSDVTAVAKDCFAWVRDNIKHSHDYHLDPITISASEVLEHGTGFCFAKSHLLAALLRANKIPTGLCYQRVLSQDGKRMYMHGLNAVFLPDVGWYRVDPRGNRDAKPGMCRVNAQFCPPTEQLAYHPSRVGEADFGEIWPEPLPYIIDAMKKYHTYASFIANLPDMAVVQRKHALTL